MTNFFWTKFLLFNPLWDYEVNDTFTGIEIAIIFPFINVRLIVIVLKEIFGGNRQPLFILLP